MKGRRILLVCALILGSSCSSVNEVHPWIIAPASEDWNKAYSKLRPEDKEAINRWAGVILTSSTKLNGKIWDSNGKQIKEELVNLAAICDGFNSNFARPSLDRWQIVDADTTETIMAPSGIQRHRFDLACNFMNSTGRVVRASSVAFGPGIDVKWFPAQTAIAAEENQAFALAFLQSVAQLYKKVNVPNKPPLQTPTSGTPAAGAPVTPPPGATGL